LYNIFYPITINVPLKWISMFPSFTQSQLMFH